MEKSFAGDLARIEVPDLLTFLNLSQRTVPPMSVPSSSHLPAADAHFASANKEGQAAGDARPPGQAQAERVQQIVERTAWVTGSADPDRRKILTELSWSVPVVQVEVASTPSSGIPAARYDDVAPPTTR
jgi:hypothetical protein